jgi:hypothetical protein
MTQTTITTAPDQSQPAPAKAKNPGRCHFRFPRGRCKLPALDSKSGLCLLHSKAPKPRDTDDLSGVLFDKLPEDELPDLQTPEDVSTFLARVVVLLAEGRITPRRATVLTYASSLLLRCAIFINKRPPEIIWDLDRPRVGDDPESRRAEEPSPALTGGTR